MDKVFQPKFPKNTDPKPDMKKVMDYKQRQIAMSQNAKEESIRLSSSGRDATMIVTTFYPGVTDAEKIQELLIKWREWFYVNIYTMDESTYKRLNPPF